MAAALGHVAAELCLSGRWPVQIAIKQVREEKGWTQQELADEMDMDLRTVRKGRMERESTGYCVGRIYVFA